MKKITSFLLIVFLLAIFAATPVSAATSAGIKPNSFFYFFDTSFEKINLFFTFNPEKKAKKALEYANERLVEAETITDNKDTDAIKAVMENYEANIALASEKSKEVKDQQISENLFSTIADSASKNQEVLNNVLTKVPEEAKEAILKAIEASKKEQEQAIKQIAELKGEVEKLKQEIAKLKQNDKAEKSDNDENLKLETEKAKFEAEIAKAKAEAEKLRLEAKKFEAEKSAKDESEIKSQADAEAKKRAEAEALAATMKAEVERQAAQAKASAEAIEQAKIEQENLSKAADNKSQILIKLDSILKEYDSLNSQHSEEIKSMNDTLNLLTYYSGQASDLFRELTTLRRNRLVVSQNLLLSLINNNKSIKTKLESYDIKEFISLNLDNYFAEESNFINQAKTEFLKDKNSYEDSARNYLYILGLSSY